MEERVRDQGRAKGDSAPAETGLLQDDQLETDRPEGPILSSEASGFQSLDRRIVWVWRVEHLIFCSFLLVGLGTGGVLLWALTPAPRLVPVLMLLAPLVLLPLLGLWLPRRQFDTRSYRLGERIFELRSGIFWKKSVLIPLSRLQHVDLNQGPLERRHGLATLEIHTAGTTAASHQLEGLAYEVGSDLRERLVAAADLDAG